MTRRRLAVYAICALLAAAFGLFPSGLTALAPFMLATGIAAIAGIVRPDLIPSRRWTRRLLRLGGSVAIVVVVLVAAAIGARVMGLQTRRPVTLVLRGGIPERVRVIHEVRDGEPRSLRWGRRHVVDARGLAYTRHGLDRGGFNPDDPYPATVLHARPGGRLDTIWGTWVRSGYTQAGQCFLSYTEFVVGDGAPPPVADVAAAGTDWIDSLPLWGVECRPGGVYRAAAGSSPPVPTDLPCYYERFGSLECGDPRVVRRRRTR